jgi:hypothetical protein
MGMAPIKIPMTDPVLSQFNPIPQEISSNKLTTLSEGRLGQCFDS